MFHKKLIVEASSDPVDELIGIIQIKQSDADKMRESQEWYLLPLSDVSKGTNTYIDANIFLFIAFKEKHIQDSFAFNGTIFEKESG